MIENDFDAYQSALAYLQGFINFETSGLNRQAAEHITLERPAALLALLGNPHRHFPSLLIAGTKGKGSVAAISAACLQAAGLRVGLYTSPHLQAFPERIQVLEPEGGGGPIQPDEVVALVARLQAVAGDVPGVTWYELLTATAFCYFSDRQVDVAVVEVGLGGRLDATNLLAPLVSVITAISLDHTTILGDTLAKIAYEKAGIIKANTPLVLAPQAAEAQSVLTAVAAERGAPLTQVGDAWRYVDQAQPVLNGRQELRLTRTPEPAFIPLDMPLTLALTGRHQLENATVALAALAHLQDHFPRLNAQAVATGLAAVRWPGRLQRLVTPAGSPAILLDGAHNVDSAARLVANLQADKAYERLWWLIGITVDKDTRGILQTLLPAGAGAVVTAAEHPRATPPAVLQRQAADLGFTVHTASGVAAALVLAQQLAAPNDLICVTGSLFIVGNLLNHWESLQSGQ